LVAADFGLDRPFQRAEFGTFNVYDLRYNFSFSLRCVPGRRLVREIIHVVIGAAIAAVLLGRLITDRPVSVWRRQEWFEFAACSGGLFLLFLAVVYGGPLLRALLRRF
jgi:hypothetical protein